MTPAPSLQELIDTVRHDAPNGDTMALLATVASTVAELEEVGDSLLGHYVDQCRRDGHSWSEISGALGVTKQAAHKRFALLPPTFERFTQRARNTIGAATDAARAFGRQSVGTEHLLLGLFAEPEGLAGRILGECRAEYGRVAELVVASTEPVADSPDAVLPFSPQAAVALREALTVALELGHNYIGTEHILLGLLRQPEGPAAPILVELGVSFGPTKARVLELLAGFGTPR